MKKTDPDSRMMRTQGQPTVQGYNAQAAVTRGQVIVAAEIAVESPDFGHLEPAVGAALSALEEAGVTQRPETVLADAGYWHTRQIENIVSDGIQVLVPPDAGLRDGARPGWDKGPYAFMRRVLASDDGHELYKHRKATVEPVFAQNKFGLKNTEQPPIFQRLSERRVRDHVPATHIARQKDCDLIKEEQQTLDPPALARGPVRLRVVVGSLSDRLV